MRLRLSTGRRLRAIARRIRSVTGGERPLLADQRAVVLPRGFAAGPDCLADAIPGDAGLPGGGNGLTEFAFGEGTAQRSGSDRCLFPGDGRLEVRFEDARQFLGLLDDLLVTPRHHDQPPSRYFRWARMAWTTTRRPSSLDR